MSFLDYSFRVTNRANCKRSAGSAGSTWRQGFDLLLDGLNLLAGGLRLGVPGDQIGHRRDGMPILFRGVGLNKENRLIGQQLRH